MLLLHLFFLCIDNKEDKFIKLTLNINNVLILKANFTILKKN